LQNRLDNESRKNYFRLNVILIKKQFTINNVDCITKLRDYIYTKSNFKYNCTKFVYAILLLLLIFELSYILLFVNNVYYCYNIIQCKFDKIYMLEALDRLQQSYWTVVTKTKILEYLEPKRHVCMHLVAKSYVVPIFRLWT